MSCGQIALKKANITVDNYYASEIKPFAIRCTQHNFPDTIQVGSVTDLKYENGTLKTNTSEINVGKIDLLIGGSPCQDFSIANVLSSKKERLGLLGNKSVLFYEYLRLKEEIQPKYFLLENVKMDKDSENQLNLYLKCQGQHINSNLFSFQNRERIYWSNIQYDKTIEDKEISFQSFKDTNPDYCNQFKMKKTASRIRMWNNGLGRTNQSSCTNITFSDKVGCLTRKQDRCPNSGLIECEDFGRYLTRRELELAQTVPIGYTNCVSYLQAQDLLGDGWTVDVIAHIFSSIS